ncbi:MAG: hypothetical protein Q4A39_03375 [Eubacteriales bacterium]|nr:hypothetical protein [Eubacteriales bacterium]
MNKRRMYLERGKNALIILLSLSAVLLILQTDQYGSLMEDSHFLTEISQMLGSGESGTLSGSGLSAGESAAGIVTPTSMAVNSAAGMHYGVKYDADGLESCYGHFSALLGEALGSSGAPEKRTEEQWREVLSAEGVYFDFSGALPLRVLAGLLGTEMTSAAGGDAARRLCLVREQEGVSLWYLRDSDEVYYRCRTALNYALLSARLEAYVPNGAFFAWEAGQDDMLDPYFLFLESMPDLNRLEVEYAVPSETAVEAMLGVLGMNRFVASRYDEADGTIVYVEEDKSLRLYADGTLVFRLIGDESGDGSVTSAETAAAVETALRLAASVQDVYGGNAAFVCTDVSYNSGTDEQTIRFDYVVEGIPLRWGGDSAFTVTLRKGTVVRLTAYLWDFRIGERSVPLPEVQAAAVVTASGGGEPMLIYELQGNSAVPAWVIRPMG